MRWCSGCCFLYLLLCFLSFLCELYEMPLVVAHIQMLQHEPACTKVKHCDQNIRSVSLYMSRSDCHAMGFLAVKCRRCPLILWLLEIIVQKQFQFGIRIDVIMGSEKSEKSYWSATTYPHLIQFFGENMYKKKSDLGLHPPTHFRVLLDKRPKRCLKTSIYIHDACLCTILMTFKHAFNGIMAWWVRG